MLFNMLKAFKRVIIFQSYLELWLAAIVVLTPHIIHTGITEYRAFVVSLITSPNPLPPAKSLSASLVIARLSNTVVAFNTV